MRSDAMQPTQGATQWFDLAPHHKMGLPLCTRVLIAPGISRLGFPRQIPYTLEGVGAIITGPWTWEEDWPRYPFLVERPGGVLWLPGQGPRSTGKTLQRLAKDRPPAHIALLAALSSPSQEHTAAAARHLGDSGLISGIVIEVREQEPLAHVLARLTIAADASGLPVLVALPLTRVEELVAPCLHAGVSAFLVGMPPVGLWPGPQGWQRVRLYGPLLLPLTLDALARARRLAGDDVPIVALGGIHSPEDALLCREAGADAVALDTAVWVEPDLPARVNEALQAWEAETGLGPQTKQEG